MISKENCFEILRKLEKKPQSNKRGPANQIGVTKWKDSYTITRGKANTLL